MEYDEHGERIVLAGTEKKVTKVLISMHALRWLNHSPDERLKRIFQKRLSQLALGYQSYCTQKTLQGAGDIHLWEAKLTSGDRIIYSRVQSLTDELAHIPSILIWYVFFVSSSFFVSIYIFVILPSSSEGMCVNTTRSIRMCS